MWWQQCQIEPPLLISQYPECLLTVNLAIPKLLPRRQKTRIPTRPAKEKRHASGTADGAPSPRQTISYIDKEEIKTG